MSNYFIRRRLTKREQENLQWNIPYYNNWEYSFYWSIKQGDWRIWTEKQMNIVGKLLKYSSLSKGKIKKHAA